MLIKIISDVDNYIFSWKYDDILPKLNVVSNKHEERVGAAIMRFLSEQSQRGMMSCFKIERIQDFVNNRDPMHSYDFPPYVCGKLEHIVIISMKKLEFDNHGWHDLSIYISLWEEGEKSSKGNQERWL